MTIGRLSSRFALTLLVAAVLALAVALVRGTGGGSLRVPTVAQVRSVTAWLHRLRLPATATRDASDTPCGTPVAICVIARTGTRRLAAGLHASFAALDGAPGPVACNHGSSAACSFIAHHAGARVDVLSRRLSGYRARSVVALIAIENVELAAPLVSALPAPDSLGAIPRGLRVRLRCRAHDRRGCMTYDGVIAQRAGAASLTWRWRAMLQREGWVAPPYACVAAGVGQRCRVAAARSLRSGGRRFVLLTGQLADSAGGEVRGGVAIAAVG